MKDNFIRFDWAMKRLLRDKSNYVVLEGFLSTLLEEDLRISRFLESESNQTDETDKFNRADILVEDSKGRLLVIKIQNYRELYYYHQMLYGASDILSRYTDEETDYNKICKIYSINIVYFSMIKSKDYAYHGEIIFRGLHDSDNFLKLSARQQEIFTGKDAKDIFPEYYVLRVNDFDKVAKTPLDEWIKFLKTGEIVKKLLQKDSRKQENGFVSTRYPMQKSVPITGIWKPCATNAVLLRQAGTKDIQKDSKKEKLKEELKERK